MSEIPSPCYRLARGVLSVPVEDESILLSIDAGRYYGVKGAARHLLEPLRDGIRFDEMVERTCGLYDVSAVRASEDLNAMLPRLIEAGIVERCD